MCLLLCNALGYTFVFLANEWQERHRVKATSFVELEGDKLIFKVQLSLPYQSEWKNELIDGNTAIFEGEFFKSYEQIYRGDTLYTYYKRLDLSRDNIMALMSEVHENLNLFSEKHKTTSQKSLEFSKNLTKYYVEFRSKILVWYKVEDLPRRNYFINTFFYNLSLTVDAPPPIYSIA
ncbi:MAG: hypothetical protein ACK4YV_08600 [Emticicia sp.]